MKKLSKGKKVTQENFTLPIRILTCLYAYGKYNHTISSELRITKQKRNYWLRKLETEGFIERPFHGYSEITESGKKRYRGLEKQQNKSLIRLENMRFKFPIIRGGNILIRSLQNHKIQTLKNNVTVHHGILNGFTVRIFDSTKNPCMEITSKKKLGNNIYELYCEARVDIQKMLIDVNDGNEVSLDLPEPSMKPEWAIPSPMASAILNVTQSSQIRTPKGIFNRSKDRNADWEVTDLGAALKILDMPNAIERIENKVNLVITSLNPTYFL